MSIYPVRLSEWFPPGDKYHLIMKSIVSDFSGCLHCGKKHMHWQDAIGHHAIPWGYGDIWCRQKCYDNYWKKTK
jgi:hypothetical protein